jgi:predicted nucleic acid-binding protein
MEKYGYGELAVSVVTVQELFAGASSKIRENDVLKLLSLFKILPYSEETARKAGEIERDNKSDADFADLAIAATCLTSKLSLVTLNKKDFAGIMELEVI